MDLEIPHANIRDNAERGNAPEPLKSFQLEKYFRVVNRSSFNHRKEIRLCFLQERFYFISETG